MTYLDTSALLKVLISEQESHALATTLRALPDRATSCELTIAELTRTSIRAGADAASASLLLQQLDLLELDRALLARAGRLPSPQGTFLRTADAIHLTAAMELGESEFMTYDRRQAHAAADRGFTVLTPGRTDNWYAQPRTPSA
jgi:predicted nucleic acid-binding protein